MNRLRRHLTALVYCGLLALAELAYALTPDQDAVLRWVSTNVANLRHHPVGSLIASAFVPEENPLVWLALAAFALPAVGLAFGNVRAALLLAGLHITGTLVSEGIVAWRLAHHTLPEAARHQLDTGPSFIIVPALLITIGYGRWPRRLIALTGLAILWPFLFTGLTHLDVSAVGHLTVLLLALPAALLARRAAQRRYSDDNKGLWRSW